MPGSGERLRGALSDRADPAALRAAWREALAGLPPASGPRDPDPGGCLARSARLDELLLALAGPLPPGVVLVALGGYGRRELAPRSDLDLLLLLPADREEAARHATGLVQRLWDVGVELGQAVRTLAGVREALGRDLHAATALLEGRLVGGDLAAWEALRGVVWEWLARDRERFARAKLAEAEERHQAHGPQVCVLAPDLKQGRGTLRDLQLVGLLAALTEERPPADAQPALVLPALGDPLGAVAAACELEPGEAEALARDRALLLACRAAVHEAGPGDRLDPQLQVALAARFGYRDRGHRLAVEAFMDEVYRAARRVDRLLLQLRLERHGDRTAALFRARPLAPGVAGAGDQLVLEPEGLDPAGLARALMELFRQAQRTRRRVGPRTQEQVRRALARCDLAAARGDPEVVAALREVLGGASGVAETVRAMHESGWLGALLPEVEALECLSQADPYHAWTVDEHTLAVMSALEGRAGSGLASAAAWGPREREELLREELLQRTTRRDLLRLGVLLHDAGKVGGALGHVERGAALVADVAARLGLSAGEERHVRFLVAEHLSLSRLVDKQDVDAPTTLEALLRVVGRDPERLDHLYLLTCADVQGVSPAAMTRWKDHLLTRLYERAREVLETGGAVPARPASAEELLALLRGRVADPAALEEHLRQCGRGYLSEVEPEDVLVHLELLEALGEGPCAVRCSLDEAAERVWVLARDRRGLFADLCGAISGAGYEILGASTFSRGPLVFDAFALDPVEGRELAPGERWARLEHTLGAVLRGEQAAAGLIAARVRRAPRGDEPELPPPPVRVRIASEASPTSTLVDVSAPDRVGLLHDLARALSAAGCNIHLARVATKGNRAVDVFHVTDGQGRPLGAEARQALEGALQRAALGDDDARAGPA